MTWNNPNPLANPFNSRTCRCSFNKSCKTLPQPSMSYEQIMQQQAQLHVPQANTHMRLADFQNIIDSYEKNMTWDDKSIYSLDQESLDNNQGLSKKEREYWEHAAIESAKLSSSLSKEWNDYIDQFEAMHPSKWIDEN